MSTTYAMHGEMAVPAVNASAAKANVQGWFTRTLAAILTARRRKADADIARYIALNGGVMTDEMERAISRRYGGIVGG
ncbi:MAG: hypothetical protein KJS95_14150 [Gammaproteobacteria bacterium]|nr:hypothetical protein [Gammaproteobacteria bacterium]